MKFVAEITLRTDPFDADDEEQALMRVTKNVYSIARLGAVITPYVRAQLVEVSVTEHEDLDG